MSRRSREKRDRAVRANMRPRCLCCWHEACDHYWGPWTAAQLWAEGENSRVWQTLGPRLARQMGEAFARAQEKRILELFGQADVG